MIDIYGTLGPSCSSQDVLARMFESGMTGIRLNLSHISLRESARQLEIFHAAASQAGVKPLLLVDMQGPELRIGRLREPRMLGENETVAFFDEQMAEDGTLSPEKTDGAAIPVPEVVCRAFQKGNEVLLDDGRLLLKIGEVRPGFAKAQVIRGGMLSGRKSIKVIGVDIHPPTMTRADLMNIRDAAQFGVTGIMQPFVRNRGDLITVQRALAENGASGLQLVAKIENREGMEQLDSVVARAGAFLEDIRGIQGNILISTHAIAMKGALEYLTPDSRGGYWAKHIGNCAVYRTDLENGEYTIPEEVYPD